MAYAYRNEDGTITANTTDVYGAGSTLDPEYGVPLDDTRQALAERIVQKAFPGRPYIITGGLWDYQNPANEKDGETHPFKELPIGDYRIKFTDDQEPSDIVMRTTKHMSEMAVQIEHATHGAYKAQGLNVQSIIAPEAADSLMLEDKLDGNVKIHFVEFVRTTDSPDKSTPELYRDSYLPALGVLLARTDKANQALDEDIIEGAKESSRQTTITSWENGLELSEQFKGDATFEQTFNELRQHGAAALQNTEYSMVILAAVPKNIPSTPENELIVLSQMNAPRSYLPKLTDNIAYHLAMAGTRHILINPVGVESPKELAKFMEKLLEGYNQEINTDIKVPELTKAIRTHIALETFTTLDHGRSNDPAYLQNVDAHIEEITNRELERYRILNEIDTFYQNPPPPNPVYER
ncbi:MAG: hypothetical protein DHS20C02_19240 [Micavibrio sp.]|nr:MAG: hypothetical protein DHS20C02_19240 [Micavibrio sp.]